MKKNLLIGFILFLSIHVANAQIKWFVSPVLGVNMSPLKENPDDPSLLKTGVSFGALTGPVLKDHWRINFGLTFNQRYTNYSYEESIPGLSILGDLVGSIIGIELDLYGAVSEDNKTEYWTVDFPVTVDYMFKSGFFIEGGFYINSVTKASSQIETTTHIPILEVIDIDDLNLGFFETLILESLIPDNGTVEKSSKSTNGLNSTNFGLIGGIGTDAGKVQLKLQYQYGFNDIRSDGLIPGVSNQQAISFHVAYLFFPTSGPGSSKLKPKYDLELIK